WCWRASRSAWPARCCWAACWPRSSTAWHRWSRWCWHSSAACCCWPVSRPACCRRGARRASHPRPHCATAEAGLGPLAFRELAMNLLSDFRYAVRALLARPAFTLVAVLTLALGIGANTAVFSVVHGLLLSPLPYKDGERLVQVYNTYPGIGLEFAGTSIPDYLDRKEQAGALEDLFIYTGSNFNLADAGTPEHVQAILASPS